MAYNGFWADFLFNTGVVAAWCVFLWRVLDGPRFSWWGTALLTLVIDAAYLLPVLLLTTAGSALRLLLYPTGALALAFLLFYGKPGRKLLAVAAELTASVLVEMLFSAATMRAADFQMDAHYSVWADPHAVLYGGVFLLFLALVLLVVSLPFLRARNNLSGRQLLVFSVFPVTQILCSAAIQALIFYPPRYEYTSVLLVVTALFLVSDSLLFRTMVRTEQRVQLEVENELLESQLDAQLAHYGDLTAQYEQIRTMRHDISHHLNTINALLQAGNLQAASEYSEQLLPAQAYSSRLGSCRNPVVDAFLYTRVQDAQARGRAARRPGAGGRVAAGGAAGVEHRPHRRLRQPARQRLGSLQRHSGRADHAARAYGQGLSRHSGVEPRPRPAAAGQKAPAHPGAGARGGLSCAWQPR